MSSPEYEESSGKMLEAMLAAQKSVRDNMRTYLETMNVPTREDIARLGELVVGLEEKIDQVVDRLDTIETPSGRCPRAPPDRLDPEAPQDRPGPSDALGPAGRPDLPDEPERSVAPAPPGVGAGWPCRTRDHREASHCDEASREAGPAVTRQARHLDKD